MSFALIVLWLGTAESRHAHQPDLDGWAVSRERRLAAPPVEAPLPPAAHDDAASERIEALLAEARTQAYSGDAAAARDALDAADALLRRSPELPESSWLAAEILHERALSVASQDSSAAAAFEQRSVALGGPRAPAFAATTKGGSAPGKGAGKPIPESPSEGEQAPAVEAAASLVGPLPTDVVEVDGVEVAVPRTVVHGAHHVRVLRAGRLAWAGWIDAESANVGIPVPEPVPCSTTDLAGTSSGNATNDRVLCEEYVKVRPAGPERIEVALCRHAWCGQWLPWSRAWGATLEGPMQPRRESHGAPPWLVWTAAGVAAVLVGGFALAEAGVFAEHAPPREMFTFVAPK
jgi:hypothetical protein